MTIETDNGIKKPATAELISETLKSGPNRFDFVVLSKENGFFLQAVICDEPCHVEYCEGGESEHYYAETKLSFPELEELMIGYLEERSDWKSNHNWLPISEMHTNTPSDISWTISGI